MRRYETIFIADPDIPEEERKALLERLTGIMDSQGAYMVAAEEWGTKKLAYEVKRKKRGYYILLDYCAKGQTVHEMERVMRIDDRVLRYLTVQLSDNVDIETLKKQLAEEAAEKEKKAQAAQQERARREAEAARAAEAVEKAAPAGEEPAGDEHDEAEGDDDSSEE